MSHHVFYPTTNLKKPEQLTIERGEGVYVYDTSGKRYLEGLAGLWCTALGYGNEEVVETAREQMKTLPYTHLFSGKTHPQAMALADKLAERVPVDNARVFFGSSGSDANDTIVKMMRYYHNVIGKPERYKIITRERAYHGVTVASGSLTSLPMNLAHFDPPLEALGILRTDHPHYYHGAEPGESEADFVERIVGNLEALILREGPETIAAFLAEPVTGASGVIVPPPGYYEKVQAVLDKYGIFFWADEVITGWGRTGNEFGCTTMNIEQPALMTFAKQLSSAYFPISAAVVRGDIHDAMIEPSNQVGAFGHGYTYSGHPVGCAVALKVLEIYERDNLYTHAAEVGAYFQKRLREFRDHPLVGEVRGVGLIAAVELDPDDDSMNTGNLGQHAFLRCQENGLIVRVVAGDSLAVCPPLIISREQVDEIVHMMARSLDETLDYAVNHRS